MRSDYRFEKGHLEILSGFSWKRVIIPSVKIIDLIGDGANAVVVKGLQEPLKREVAVKIWLPNSKSRANKVSEDQFLEEVRKLARLNDDQIVQVHSAGKCNGMFFSIMKFIDGITLEEWIKRRLHRNLEVQTKIVENILEVMSRCHSEEIFHGDLHNKNIMIGTDNKVYILDFGCSYFSRRFNQQLGKQRDNYLLTKLFADVLNNKSLLMFLNFSVPSRINGPLLNNDVRLVESKLLVSTLISMTKINMFLSIDVDFNDHDIRCEIVQHIVAAPYLNIRNFSNFFFNKCGEKLLFKFWNSLENEVIETWNTDENLDDSTFMIYSTSAAYYSLLRRIKKVKSVEEIEEFVGNLSFKKVEDYLALINFVINSTDAPYLELIDTLSKNLPRNACSSFFYELRIFLFSKILQLMRNIDATPQPEVHYHVNAEYLKLRNDESMCQRLRDFANLDDDGTLDLVSKKIVDSNSAIQGLSKAGLFVANNYYDHNYFTD